MYTQCPYSQVAPPLSYILTPTIPIPQYIPPCAGKQFFWTVSNAEFHIRRQAFANLRAPRAWDEIFQSVQRCIPVLPYSSFPHICKLLRMVDRSVLNGLNYPRQWLYASFSFPSITARQGPSHNPGPFSHDGTIKFRVEKTSEVGIPSWPILLQNVAHYGPRLFFTPPYSSLAVVPGRCN